MPWLMNSSAEVSSAVPEMFIYRLYGITLTSDFAFANRIESIDGPPDLRVERVMAAPHWETAPLRYKSPYRLADGRSEITLHVAQGYDVLTFTDMARFFVYPERVAYQLLDDARGYAIEILLLGTVLSHWLERRGLPALHAAAVVVEGKAVGFLASNKGGKTSLAVSLMQMGYPLLSDDILAVESSAQGFLARPGYPQMRMWPEQAVRFLGRYKDLSKVHPYLEKRRVPVGEAGLGCFYGHNTPLARLYLPTRGASALRITPLSFGEAVMALLEHSFLLGVPEALGLEAERFRLFAALAQQVPVNRLEYPDGLDLLPEVRKAVLGDVASADD